MSDDEQLEPTPASQIKQTGAQVGSAALSGAVKGAAVGGVAGAAAGAAKSAVVASARSPFIRKVIIGGIAVALIAIIVGCAVIGSAAATMLNSISQTAEQNTEYAIADDDVAGDLVSKADAAAAKYDIPRELVIAILLSNDDYDFQTMASFLGQLDPSRQYRDLRAGSVVSASEMARRIPDSGPGADSAKKVREVFVGAMAGGGFSKPQSEGIYQTALHWALGNTVDPEQEACLAEVVAVDGEEVSLNGTKFTAGQVANMKAVIGLAKTMFPGDVQAAALIGLITVRQESVFRNYANDGIMTPGKDPNPGPFGPEDYAHLTYSLELPHDAVGTDHASLGLFQQQATMGWGDFRTSTWAGGDYQGVITRLMTPTYTIGKFFAKLAALTGWQDMEPGTAAQKIQVSALPTAYSEHLTLATEIWRHYGSSSPALAVPESTGWTGATSDDPPAGGSVCAGSPVLIDGVYAWPVEVRADGSPSGYLTSKFGYRILNGVLNYHSGIDVTGNGYESAVYALTGGTVVKSNLWSAACGQYIQIAHPDGTATGYLHMVDRLVQVGDVVEPGQLIAHMGGGQPGNCTFGAHLHFYAFDAHGNRVDPIAYLAARKLVFPADRDIAAN